MMKAILGEVPFQVDGKPVTHDFFGATDRKFNIETGSYGATILGYALAESDLPPVGRIFYGRPLLTGGVRHQRRVPQHQEGSGKYDGGDGYE